MERQITVAIADDSAEIRALVRMQLERDGRFEIVAEGKSMDDAIEALHKHQPDVATLDLHMPGMETLDGLKEAQLASPSTDLFIVTGTYRPGKDPDLDRPELKGWMTKDEILTQLADRLAADRYPEAKT